MWTRFFFSSRRRHTRSLRDWSSDVCSSDLMATGRRVLSFAAFAVGALLLAWQVHETGIGQISRGFLAVGAWGAAEIGRASVGKECRCRRSPNHCKLQRI